MDNKYKIGTPLTFVWRFLKSNNDPFYFDPDKHTFRLRYYTGIGSKDVSSFMLNATHDAITWTLPAEEEVFAGNYDLLLDVFAEGLPVGHFHYNDAFSLYMTYGMDSQNAEQVNVGETITLLSVAEFQHFAAGDSAYQIAVKHGYEGTEEEWLNDPVNGIKGNGIKSFEVVGEYSSDDSAENTYRITPYVGEAFDIKVKNGKGIASVQQTTTSTESEGVNTITVAFSDGTTATFQVKNGARGNSGYSGAAEDLEVVNDLDADDPEADAAKALSAYQGYILDGKVTELGQEVNTQEDYIEATTDDQNKIIEGITTEGKKRFNTPVELTDKVSLQGNEIIVLDNTEWAEVKVDKNNKVIEGIRKDGTHVFNTIETKDATIYGDLNLNKVPAVIQQAFDEMSDEVNKVIPTHLDKECELYAMSYAYPFYYYPGNERGGLGASYNKKLVFAWISDIHGKATEYGRFVKYANHYKDVIDFMLVTGDLSTLAPNDGGWENTQGVYGKQALKPLLIGLGNHDITDNPGTGVIFDSLEDMDNELIMPWASQINWSNKGDGSYYYKDFEGNRYAYRIIMLNDYERPGLVADGSWKTISFDDSLSEYSSSAEYVPGNKVNLNGHSYEAVKTVSGVSPTRT